MKLKLKKLTKREKVIALERLAKKYGATVEQVRQALLKVEYMRFVREHPTI